MDCRERFAQRSRIEKLFPLKAGANFTPSYFATFRLFCRPNRLIYKNYLFRLLCSCGYSIATFFFVSFLLTYRLNASTPAPEDGDEVSVDQLLDLDLHGPLCDFAALNLGERSAGLCDADVIHGICSQEAQSYENAIISLMSSQEITQILKDADLKNDMRKSIDLEFRSAIQNCIQSGAVVFEKKQNELENDPGRQARIASGRSRFWHLKLRLLGRSIVIPTAEKIAGSAVLTSMRKAVFAGLCKAGIATYTSMAQPVKGYDHENACIDTPTKKHVRKMACIQLAGSACSAIGGFVDLNKWPGFTEAGESSKTALDILSVGAEGLCRFNGASPICGLVNVAAEQLALSLNSGNNDVIECTGIRQSMQCIGQTYGQDGWSNTSGIEPPRREQLYQFGAREPEVFWVKPCCYCKRQAYKTKWLRKDPLVWSKTYLSVIQKGDFEGGNCSWLEDRVYKSMAGTKDYDYTMFDNCKRVELINNACTTEGKDEMEIWIDRDSRPGGIIPIVH